jgi:hypothetical protein
MCKKVLSFNGVQAHCMGDSGVNRDQVPLWRDFSIFWTQAHAAVTICKGIKPNAVRLRCFLDSLSFRPQGEIYLHCTTKEISRFARNDKMNDRMAESAVLALNLGRYYWTSPESNSFSLGFEILCWFDGRVTQTTTAQTVLPESIWARRPGYDDP